MNHQLPWTCSYQDENPRPRFLAAIRDEFQRVFQARARQAIIGDDMEVNAADEDTMEAVVGVEPTMEVEGSLDEQELAVGVLNPHGEVRESLRSFEEEEDDKPLVFEIVAVAELAVEVRQVVAAEA
ncbi:hypothetical protein L484_018815 [Morus notabilis]|uniref:Uncharacterized protein n=1 Tax=Morus notabilis TaxID=981085 RepID=W9RIU6_9ROSA|nr:hypothetical protein L484_018815 [Morus notabilis]